MSIQRGSVSVVEFMQIEAGSALYGLDRAEAGVDLTLQEVWPFAATQIAWRNKTSATKIAKALGVPALPQSTDDGAKEGSDSSWVLPLMPGRVLRLGPTQPSQDSLEAVSKAGGYSLDLTEGRTLLRLKGSGWRWTLMKGCGLDFEALTPGFVGQSPLFKVSTLIWMTGEEEVNLLASYTYARALAEKILDAGSDQGLTLMPPEQF